MIQYPKILYYPPYLGRQCICFDKYDGNNFRVEFNPKKGFYKYGSRTELIDSSNHIMGDAIRLFNETISDNLERIISKKSVNISRGTFFFEYYGPNSFGGVHIPGDDMELCLIDVFTNNKGFMKPEEFINKFEEIKIPNIVYRGILDEELVNNVKHNIFSLKEGVVPKGIDKDNEIWMAKIKTIEWLERVKKENPILYESEKLDFRE